MNKRLTVKEAELVKLKAEGKTHKEAYGKVYSDTAKESTATSNTQKILNKPHVKQALESALKRRGITVDKIIEPHIDALKANKSYTGSEGLVESELPDYSTRMKGADRLQELMGLRNRGEQPASLHFHKHLYEQSKEYDL